MSAVAIMAALLVAQAPAPSARPLAARANLQSYFSRDDYPATAQRAREEGTAAFRLTVGPDGRVTDCTITSSSGSATLDAATCGILQRRARFAPAHDNHGVPTTASVTNRIRWILPVGPPGTAPVIGQRGSVGLPADIEVTAPRDLRYPSRIWVQIAGGADRAGLPATFARIRSRAPALLGGLIAFTTPVRATNRLLIGPFDSLRSAQRVVNQLGIRNVPAFVWTSPEGQMIELLGP